MLGRYFLKSHPNGELICDYLKNDAYIIGTPIVPQKYNQAAQEKYRAEKYDYYLRRGLPIPQQFMPPDELEFLEKRRLHNEMTKQSGPGTGDAGAFKPQIAMNLDSGSNSGKADTVAKVEEGRAATKVEEDSGQRIRRKSNCGY
jgi:hypothetical protein